MNLDSLKGKGKQAQSIEVSGKLFNIFYQSFVAGAFCFNLLYIGVDGFVPMIEAGNLFEKGCFYNCFNCQLI